MLPGRFAVDCCYCLQCVLTFSRQYSLWQASCHWTDAVRTERLHNFMGWTVSRTTSTFRNRELVGQRIKEPAYLYCARSMCSLFAWISYKNLPSPGCSRFVSYEIRKGSVWHLLCCFPWTVCSILPVVEQPSGNSVITSFMRKGLPCSCFNFSMIFVILFCWKLF